MYLALHARLEIIESLQASLSRNALFLSILYSNTPESSSPGSINSADQVVKTTNNPTSPLNDTEDSVYSEIKQDDESGVCESKREELDMSNKESELEEKKADNKLNSISK